ncbi:MAG: hypothetical protein JWM96_728 [Alphaproteobacteria bacterium]|nr:hypothetical protein [Alphaproteobacteria bacterium]
MDQEDEYLQSDITPFLFDDESDSNPHDPLLNEKNQKIAEEIQRTKNLLRINKLLDMRVYDLIEQVTYRSLDDYLLQKEIDYREEIISKSDKEPHAKFVYKDVNNLPWQRKKTLDIVRKELQICEKTKAYTSWELDKPSLVIQKSTDTATGEWYSVLPKAQAKKLFAENSIFVEQREIQPEQLPNYEETLLKRDALEQFRLNYLEEAEQVLQDIPVYDTASTTIHNNIDAYFKENPDLIENKEPVRKIKFYKDVLSKVSFFENRAALIIRDADKSSADVSVEAYEPENVDRHYKNFVIQQYKRRQQQQVA